MIITILKNTIKYCLCLFLIHSLNAQSQDVKMFIFGHSLIDHRPPLFGTPSNETTVPHWTYLLAQEAGNTYAAGGQYGFLPQHANLPPIAQWGYDIVPGVWESDTELFSEADITTVLLTAGNFMQWQSPDLEYPSDPGVSPISATEDILDWVSAQEEGVKFYIYENWPDMASYLANGFPATSEEWENYNTYTSGDFHNWWLEYQDELLITRPTANIRMIPVGPIIKEVLSDLLQNSIPITDLYEDDAPHGRSSIYFLAALITYMSVYEEPAPTTFSIPDLVHEDIIQHYSTIVDYIWSALQNFNDMNGKNRVFCPISTHAEVLLTNKNSLQITPNPNSGQFYITGHLSQYNIEIIDIYGGVHQRIHSLNATTMSVNINSLPNGVYFIRYHDQNDKQFGLQKIIKF